LEIKTIGNISVFLCCSVCFESHINIVKPSSSCLCHVQESQGKANTPLLVLADFALINSTTDQMTGFSLQLCKTTLTRLKISKTNVKVHFANIFQRFYFILINDQFDSQHNRLKHINGSSHLCYFRPGDLSATLALSLLWFAWL